MILGCHSASVGYSEVDSEPAISLKLIVQNTIGKRPTSVYDIVQEFMTFVSTHVMLTFLFLSGFVPDSDCNNYCLNSGTCYLDENGLPYCICWPGFNGTRCEERNEHIIR